MLCVVAFCEKDAKQAQDLLRWFAQLGGVKKHDCLLVCDAATPWLEAWKARDLAGQAFASVKVITNPASVPGWIPGSTSLFRAAAEWCAGQPFLWLEPDATPLRATWLDELESAYAACGKPFMGTIVNHQNANWPKPYFEGVAVYPSDCWRRFEPIWNPNESWTRAMVSVTIPNAVHTELIHFLWGEHNNPPTFAERNLPGTAVFSMAQIHPRACLFHRNKDGSLIRLLRKRMGVAVSDPKPIAVVFSYCGKDARLMDKSMRWITEIQPKLDRTAVLHFDSTVPMNFRVTIDASAKKAFKTVITSPYPTPRPPNIGWPAACNWAFREACKFAKQHLRGPWLWFEADCVATCSDWLARIEEEYERGGKPFMGCIIGGMGHANGTQVYPLDPVAYAPSILTCKSAWDTAIQSEVAGVTHRGNDVIQHCRALVNHECLECHGQVPAFKTMEDLRAIRPTTAMFHPCKDGRLIDLLRQRTAA